MNKIKLKKSEPFFIFSEKLKESNIQTYIDIISILDIEIDVIWECRDRVIIYSKEKNKRVINKYFNNSYRFIKRGFLCIEEENIDYDIIKIHEYTITLK
jgi:hypothetical protein